ncbi:hypothetical protein HDE_06629 [Halotydeus destructor]|nr:hypothetical protein HDE_06629 [Halotydeus destructor]
MIRFRQLFADCSKRPAVIAMVHARALPGTPNSTHSVQELVDIACSEAQVYKDFEVDGILVENMHDVPYVLNSKPEVTAVMTRICLEVKKILPEKPVGVQVLACQNKEALAVAMAAGLQFVRVENFVFGHLADEGFVQACAGDLMRYRRHIGCENVHVWTDIKKKHSSHSITADLTLKDFGDGAKNFLSDGLIVTGPSTAQPVDVNDIQLAKQVTDIPIILGSGVTVDNLTQYSDVEAVIVGSHFKEDGHWSRELDMTRIERFMNKIKR